MKLSRSSAVACIFGTYPIFIFQALSFRHAAAVASARGDARALPDAPERVPGLAPIDVRGQLVAELPAGVLAVIAALAPVLKHFDVRVPRLVAREQSGSHSEGAMTRSAPGGAQGLRESPRACLTFGASTHSASAHYASARSVSAH